MPTVPLMLAGAAVLFTLVLPATAASRPGLLDQVFELSETVRLEPDVCRESRSAETSAATCRRTSSSVLNVSAETEPRPEDAECAEGFRRAMRIAVVGAMGFMVGYFAGHAGPDRE